MAFAHIQSAVSGETSTPALTIACTFGATVGSGGIVCGFVTWGTSAALSSVTDDKANTYNLETAIYDSGENQSACAFSLGNITNGPKTLTANFGTSVGFTAIFADEFSGAFSASDPRDGTAHGGQQQTSPTTGTDATTSGNFTTSTNGDLIYSGTVNTNDTSGQTVGTGFTLGASNTLPDISMACEYRVQTTAGAGTAGTWTSASSVNHTTYMIAIKPAAGGDTFANNGAIFFI